MKTTVVGSFGTLRVEREVINVETMGSTKPNPKWKYTDEAGHAHYFNVAGNGYPTLVLKADESWWCDDCRELHEEWHWQCSKCHEKIEPSTVPDSEPQYIPGPATYYLNDKRITEAECLNMLAEVIGKA